MENEKVVATLSQAVQIGMEEWEQRRTSRVFSTTRPLRDMLAWAESEGVLNPTVNDLHLSTYTGESI